MEAAAGLDPGGRLELPGLVLDRPERRRSEKTLAGLRHCRQPADTDRFQVHEFSDRQSQRDYGICGPVCRHRVSDRDLFLHFSADRLSGHRGEQHGAAGKLLGIPALRVVLRVRHRRPDRGSAGILFAKRPDRQAHDRSLCGGYHRVFDRAAQKSHHRGELCPVRQPRLRASTKERGGRSSISTSRVTRRWRWVWACSSGCAYR